MSWGRLGSISSCRIGVKKVTHAKLLGVDFGAGRRRQIPVQKRRLMTLKRRACLKLRAFRRAGGDAEQVAKTGALPAAAYGVGTVGVSDCGLRQAREAVSHVVPGNHSGNLTLRLAVSQAGLALDPIGVLAVDPIYEWARAVWQRTPDVGVLQATLEAETHRLNRLKHPWSGVTGPGGAFIMSAHRLGWSILSATVVVTEKGHTIDMQRYAPAATRELAQVAAREWAWKTMRKGDGKAELLRKGVWIELLHSIIYGKRGKLLMNIKQRSYVRSAVAGNQWPQKRIHDAGFSEQWKCTRCNEGVGTLYHRHCECPATEFIRREHVDPELRRLMAREGASTDPMINRLLLPHPAMVLKEPNLDAIFRWYKVPPNEIVTGEVCTDGSAVGVRLGAPRAGWGAAMFFWRDVGRGKFRHVGRPSSERTGSRALRGAPYCGNRGSPPQDLLRLRLRSRWNQERESLEHKITL